MSQTIRPRYFVVDPLADTMPLLSRAGEYLVGFHLRESFDFARRRSLHLDEIDCWSFVRAVNSS